MKYQLSITRNNYVVNVYAITERGILGMFYSFRTLMSDLDGTRLEAYDCVSGVKLKDETI